MSAQAPALLQRPLLHVPPLQSELVEHAPHMPLLHVPLPLQSELVEHPPHMPLLHVPVLQSELVEQWLHVPPLHVPWPLQSEVVEQLPHLPLLQFPKPAQSELVEHAGTASSPSHTNMLAGESCVTDAATCVVVTSCTGFGAR